MFGGFGRTGPACNFDCLRGLGLRFGSGDFQYLPRLDAVAFDAVGGNQVGNVHVVPFGDAVQRVAVADFV